MERRYKDILDKKGQRKMIPKRDNLDRIVVVVDECSDLYGKVPRGSSDYDLITECKDITNHIARKGRAAGIHLILATQRAATDTLDSRIVSNIPAKVCFKMANVSNSVLILNNKCAFELDETKGRAYWQFGTTLTQIQAPFIDEKEVKEEAELAKFEFEECGKSKMVGKMITEEIETITRKKGRY